MLTLFVLSLAPSQLDVMSANKPLFMFSCHVAYQVTDLMKTQAIMDGA